MAGLTPDVGDFLTRLTRLDGTALVRIRRASAGAELWARVPWDVLVARTTQGLELIDDDITVSAAEWLAGGEPDLATLRRRDGEWRVGLPAGPGVVVETMPSSVVRRVDEAAAATLRETTESGLGGRAVGSRALRDALLDHVPIVVTVDDDGRTVEIPQRIVQAVARMGFLGPDLETLRIVALGPWVGISTAHGAAWWRRPVSLAIRTNTA